jgi:hypothetical protein
MSADLPPDIQVIETGDGARYLLPRSALGGARVPGVMLAAFGLAPIGMGIAFAFSMLEHFRRPGEVWIVATLIPVLFAGLFVLFGIFITLFGVWLFTGHAEIVVANDEIRSEFRLGPIAWRGRRSRRQVRRLVIERSSRSPGPGSEGASLFAETDRERPLLLAFLYPHDWLLLLATDMVDRCGSRESAPRIVERHAGRTSSRGWRRYPDASYAKKQEPGCFLWAFGLGFFASGLLAFVLIFLALVRGDPNNSLEGDYPAKVLWILFPFPFILVGTGLVVHAYRPRRQAGLSPEQLKAQAAQDEYPTVPLVSQVPGRELSVRLTSQLGAGCGLALLLCAFLLCTGIVSTIGGYGIRLLSARHWDGAGIAGFFVLVIGVFWAMVTRALVKDWRLWRLGHPIVEVSAGTLYCGEDYEVLVTLPGPARLRWLRLALVCEEKVSYSDGSSRQDESRVVHDEQLARQDGVLIEWWAPLRLRTSFRVPRSAMHAFKAEHNEVRWLVRIEGEAERMLPLPFTHDFPLPVRPARSPGAKRWPATS